MFFCKPPLPKEARDSPGEGKPTLGCTTAQVSTPRSPTARCLLASSLPPSAQESCCFPSLLSGSRAASCCVFATAVFWGCCKSPRGLKAWYQENCAAACIKGSTPHTFKSFTFVRHPNVITSRKALVRLSSGGQMKSV